MSAPTPRYTDPFLNALMYPHQTTVRAELWFADAKVGDLALVSGQVLVDRGATVRRTLDAALDPHRTPIRLDDKLAPYGSTVKVWRGIRYPDNTVTEYPVFAGRVEAVEFGRLALGIRAADRGADVADARFEAPYKATKGMKVVDQMKALILDAVPGAVVTDLTGNTQVINTPATWDRERTAALDNLATTIGAEWYAMADGSFRIRNLPVLGPTSPATWIVDSGDIGVVVTRSTSLDRARVYNAVVVNGEPPDGSAPAYGVERDDSVDSPTRWGGPFGKVPRFFSSQFITTNAQAKNTARALLGDAVSSLRNIAITCVANPRLIVGDIVYVHTRAGDFDGMYFIDSMTIPLDPESPMTMVCNQALEWVDDPPALRMRPRLLEEGTVWPIGL